MFKGLTAWFSKSVSKSKRQKWLAGNGKEASFDSAQFIFSQDAACTDTQRIFESPAYLDEHLSVFHANYISECVKKQSKEAVPLGKYILLSTVTQEAVRTGMRIKFLWETDGNTSDGQSVNSDSEEEIPGNQSDNQSHKKSKESQQHQSSSQTRNQSNTRNNERTKENQSKESQQHQGSSQTRNQSGTRNNERTKENQSKESQQHQSSSQTRNQSGTRNNERTKENQSDITGQPSTEKSKSEAPEVTTQDKQSSQPSRQSDPPNRHSNQPNRQSNQLNVASQSKQLQQCVNTNSSQKETVKDKREHSSNDTEMVDKDLRRSPRKHGQTKTENHTQGKRLKVTEPTTVVAEKEEVWRLENLAKVMDRIDEFTVGQCGFDVYDKRRSKTGH